MLPSPGWGRWRQSRRMRSSPAPRSQHVPPDFPRTRGPELQANSPVDCIQRRAGGSPCCLPRLGVRSARKTVRRTVLSEGRAAPVLPSPGWGRWWWSRRMRSSPAPRSQHVPPDLPRTRGPECQANSPVDCFQRRAGGGPGRWPQSGRMRSSPRPGTPPSPAVDAPSSLLSCSCVPRERPHPSPR